MFNSFDHSFTLTLIYISSIQSLIPSVIYTLFILSYKCSVFILCLIHYFFMYICSFLLLISLINYLLIDSYTYSFIISVSL